MAGATTDLDWDKFRSSSKSLTIEELASYTRASVDPLTTEIALFICEQFSLSPQGQRNLAHAYGNLPAPNFENIGLGYYADHMVFTILASDLGYAFLGVCGVLAEYFDEDVVTDVFTHIARAGGIPNELRPSRSQWKSLVHVCCGVIITGGFGLLIDKLGVAESGLDGLHHTNPSVILDAFKAMSSLTKNKDSSQIEIYAGLDAGWFAAVAEWLFDLNVIIRDRSGNQLNSNFRHDGEKPHLTIHFQNPGIPVDTGVPAVHPELTIKSVTGGREQWQTLFRSCFGHAFQDLNPDKLAKVVGSAAVVWQETVSRRMGGKTFFLPQASSEPGRSGEGLILTITSWFPELQRLRSRMERCLKYTLEEGFSQYIEQMNGLEENCKCEDCHSHKAKSSDNPIPISDLSLDELPKTICQASLVQTIVILGLYIARMVVIAELYPKRSGIIALYIRQKAIRRAYLARNEHFETTEDRLNRMVNIIPTPAQMLEAAILIFTGSAPPDLAPETMGLTSSGVGVFHTDYRLLKGPSSSLMGIKVTIGTLELFGRVRNRGVYVTEPSGMEYEEAMETMRANATDFRMIAKESGDNIIVNLIKADSEEEKLAIAMGWRPA